MRKQKIWTAAALSAAIMLAVAGCGSSQGSKGAENSGSEAGNNESATDHMNDDALYGQVSAVSDSEITVKLAKRSNEPGGETEFTGDEQTVKVTEETEILKESGMGGGPKGGAGEAPGKPEGENGEASEKPEGENGEAPEKPEGENGEAPNMTEGEAPEKPEGESSEGKDGAAPQMPAEEAKLSDIQSGDMVRITLKEDTAVTITIQSIPGAAPGETPEGAAAEAKLGGVYIVDGKNASSVNDTYESKEKDISTVLVTNQGSLKMSGATLEKTGDTRSSDQSNFYGLNAVFAVEDGGTAELYDSTVHSSADGANAVFSTGEDSKISIDNIKIHTKGDSSRGLDATYGGSITATNVDITTEGAHCAPIATDRGEGTITVNGGKLSASGEGSPCVYSTGDITVKNVEGTAAGSQAAVVEGKNSITLEKCNLTGYGENGIMLYQSTSGDAAEGTAAFTAKDSTITTESKGPMFYVTNTKAEASLDNTVLNFGGGILAQVSGNDTNNWGKPGENGGDFTLKTTGQKLNGDIVCDSISTVSIALKKGSTLEGTLNADQKGKSVSISLDTDSVWTLTGDSYVNVLDDADESFSNIISNGYTVYYDPAQEENEQLGGKTINLSDGGKIMPE